jgi:hypothetical protein
MPEINPFNKNILQEISHQKERPDVKEKITGVINDLDIPVVGSGTSSIVVEHPFNKEKVVSVNYENMNELHAKDIYYSSKIYNTLFPHNFPKIHFASAEQNSEKLNGTIREKVQGEVIANTSKEKNLHPFGSIRGEIHTLSDEPYNLPIGLDGTIGNFIENDNATYYVDTLSVGSIMKEREKNKTKQINIEAIRNYMMDKKYSTTDIKTVSSSLERLQQLYNEHQDPVNEDR